MDEMTPEQTEIIRNARAAEEAGEITKAELHDVYRMIAVDMAELSDKYAILPIFDEVKETT
jgi:hypothetical protein